MKQIVRVARRHAPYVTIDKTIYEDPRLSLRAKGLHGYLIGKPDDWEVRIADVATHCTERRDAIRAALNELRRFGFAELYELRDHRGKVLGYQWVIYETPDLPRHGSLQQTTKRGLFVRWQPVPLPSDDPVLETNIPQPDSPEAGKPEAAHPLPENPSLTKELTLPSNQVTKEPTTTGAAAAASTGQGLHRAGARPRRRTGAPFPAEMEPIAALLMRNGFPHHDAQQQVLEFGEPAVRRAVGLAEWNRENGVKPKRGHWRGFIVDAMRRGYEQPEGVMPARTAQELTVRPKPPPVERPADAGQAAQESPRQQRRREWWDEVKHELEKRR